MNLTPHFSLAEFTKSETARAKGLSNAPPPEHLPHLKATAELMEQIRTLLGGKPITVSSGYRNPEVNKLVGGVPNSDHALGYACDFVCPSFGTPFQVATFLSTRLKGFDQLIHERKPGSWWVHVSANPRRRGELLTLTAWNPNKYKPGILPVTLK